MDRNWRAGSSAIASDRDCPSALDSTLYLGSLGREAVRLLDVEQSGEWDGDCHSAVPSPSLTRSYELH